MKTVKKALLSTVIALAAFESIPSSQAAPVTWVSGSGDLFLGFENAAGNLNYLYDLGAGSTFAASVLAGTYAGVNLNADLTSVFGSDWATNATTGVSYGIFGLPSNKTIVYATVANGNLAPVLKASGALATTLAHYNALGAGYNTDLTVSAQTLTLGVKQIVGTAPDTGFSTWTGNTPSTTPFATYNVTFENLVSGNLDFYGTTGTTSTLKGTLQISQAGVFGVVAAVPEPSTYALCGLGAIAMIVAYRRKSKKAA